MRNYLAFWDDGHDYGEFEFTSYHRANSKANIQDAKDTAISRYGYRRGSQLRITQTQLNK